jgi:hypothetical protein
MFSFVLVAALLCSAAVDATLCVGDSQCGCLCVADLCTASNASPSSFACTAMGAAAAAANCTTACNESLYRTKPYAVVWIRPSASGTAVENIASKRSVSLTAYGGHKAIIDRTDSSLTFDGNWHVSTPLKENNVNLGDDFALMFWLKTTMVGVARSSKAGEPTNVWYQFPYIVHADASGEANDFGVTLNGGKVMFGVRTPQWNVLSSTAVNDGLWHHVAIRFAAKQMQLFVDGKLQGAVTTAVVGPAKFGPSRDLWSWRAGRRSLVEWLALADRLLRLASGRRADDRCAGSSTATDNVAATRLLLSECTHTVMRAIERDCRPYHCRANVDCGRRRRDRVSATLFRHRSEARWRS